MAEITKPSIEAVSKAASVLLNSGIVVVPTIRWYMVCCMAENQECIEAIFEAKRRPLSKQPLFVLPDKNAAASYFAIGGGAERLINELWPGELSLLLSWADQEKASRFRAVDQTYALANNPPGLFGEIASAASIPLAATTVNTYDPSESSNLGPAISLEEVVAFTLKTGIKIDMIIDGGICPAFNHTTIIDCRHVDQTPKMVREGFVHERAIKLALFSST